MDRETIRRLTRNLFDSATGAPPGEVETVPDDAADLSAAYICGWVGHVPEGQVAIMADGSIRLIGRCSRCGAGALTGAA